MKEFRSISNLFLALCFLLTLAAFCSGAQGPAGEVDLSFDPGSGVNGTVNVAALQLDGRVLIGGNFTTVRGLHRSRLARLNADGSADASFNPGVSAGAWGALYSIALQADGKVLAAHSLGLSRLNSNGTLDEAFSVDIGPPLEEGGVYAVAIQPDGKVLMAGGFSSVNGTPRTGLARLNTNGSIDRSFFFGAVLGWAHALKLQPDGKLLILAGNTVVRLNTDGSLDPSFIPDEEVSGPSHMTLQADGKVLVAGYFKSGGYGIVRLHGNGSLDGSFHPDLPPYEGFPYVGSLLALPDGRVLITGTFSTVNGTSRNRIARLNADGSLDGGFDPGAGANGEIMAVAPQANGQVVIGRSFTTIIGRSLHGVVRLLADGRLDLSFESGGSIDNRVTSLVVQPDGKLLIGGAFTTVRGFTRHGIARLHADGSLDTAFDPAIKFYATASQVRSIALQPDGGVLITGIFNTQDASGTHPQTIARIHPDGSLDPGFQPDLAALIPGIPCPPEYWYCDKYSTATQVCVQPDGSVIVSGDAVTIAYAEEAIGYFSTSFVVRLNANGSPDSTFQFGSGITDAAVQRMILQPDGKLLVTGSFKVNGASRGMIRLQANGSLDVSFNPGALIPGSQINSLALQSDGKVVIGGHPSMLRETGRYAIGRLNADGSVDGTFNSPVRDGDTVQSIALQPDGQVIIAGQLYSISGINGSLVSRLNADGTLDNGFHSAMVPGFVMAMTVQPDGGVIIGGDFETVSGELRPHVARLYGDSAAPSLSISLVNDFAILSWPATAVSYQLSETPNLSQPSTWTSVTLPPITAGKENTVNVPIIGERRFFRLTPAQSAQ